MLQALRKSFIAYAATHKAEVRLFWSLLALIVVVASASSIEDFFIGFADGASAVIGP